MIFPNGIEGAFMGRSRSLPRFDGKPVALLRVSSRENQHALARSMTAATAMRAAEDPLSMKRYVELDYRLGVGCERTRFFTSAPGAVGFLSLSTFFK
jgi:hypothetical protein